MGDARHYSTIVGLKSWQQNLLDTRLFLGQSPATTVAARISCLTYLRVADVCFSAWRSMSRAVFSARRASTASRASRILRSCVLFVTQGEVYPWSATNIQSSSATIVAQVRREIFLLLHHHPPPYPQPRASNRLGGYTLWYNVHPKVDQNPHRRREVGEITRPTSRYPRYIRKYYLPWKHQILLSTSGVDKCCRTNVCWGASVS